jgi:hypothetical protein
MLGVSVGLLLAPVAHVELVETSAIETRERVTRSLELGAKQT